MSDNDTVSEFIAIAHPHVYLPTKRDALLFDRIGIIRVDDSVIDDDPMVRAELDWLEANGVVFETNITDFNGDYPAEAIAYAEDAFAQLFAAASLSFLSKRREAYVLLDTESKIAARLEQFSSYRRNIDSSAIASKAHRILSAALIGPESSALAASAFGTAAQKSARFVTQLYRIISQVDAVPIGPGSPGDEALTLGSSPAPIVRVVLSALPVPSEDTPWERVLDFRADKDARLALRRLRRWMKTVAREARPEAELKDELEALLDDYTEYMRFHHLKVKRGALVTIVTTAGEVAESIAKLRFAKLANLLFATSAQRINLLEAELSAPGREIAYISEARKTFGVKGA